MAVNTNPLIRTLAPNAGGQVNFPRVGDSPVWAEGARRDYVGLIKRVLKLHLPAMGKLAVGDGPLSATVPVVE